LIILDYTIFMSADEILRQIRERIIYSYADYSKGSVQIQVERVALFVDYLINVFKFKDPSQIDPYLDQCLALQETGQNESFSTELNSLFSFVYACSQRELPAEQSNQFIAELFPILAYSLQYIYKREFGAYLDRMSEEQAALEKLDKSKSGFISIAAHELKTPLTLLEGYTAMMREIIEQKQIFDEHLFLLMDGMNSGSRRLREIINDMIDVSLIDNEMLSLSFQPTWVNKLLEKLELEFQSIIQSRMMSLEINRFEGDKILNYYDGERIFQALSNVVSNAIKYTPDGGKVIIKGHKIDDYYELLVIDSGIGVDPINQSKIFSKFDPIGDISLHSSGKTKFKGGGPGLGLPIAKGIIEAHGGRIWVESVGYDEIKCPGSTFHILLPILTGPPDQAAEILFNPQFIHRSSAEN
jgi:signal transduction histidine kinase